MSESELLSLLNETTALVDASFGFWLTASFSVLIASFFAGSSLDKVLKRTVVSLYIITTLISSIRMAGYGESSSIILSQLDQMGSQVYVLSAARNNLLGILYLITMVGGTIATVLYILRPSDPEGT